MGADIHMVLEKRAKVRDSETWVGVNAFPYLKTDVFTYDEETHKSSMQHGSTHWSATGRNYDLFGELAGVRRSGPQPKGIPDDASDLALMMIDSWGEDGHSHTWLTMDEALPIFVRHGQFGDPGKAVLEAMKSGTAHAMDAYMTHFWNIEDDSDLSDYRLIVWFDN